MLLLNMQLLHTGFVCFPKLGRRVLFYPCIVLALGFKSIIMYLLRKKKVFSKKKSLWPLCGHFIMIISFRQNFKALVIKFTKHCIKIVNTLAFLGKIVGEIPICRGISQIIGCWGKIFCFYFKQVGICRAYQIRN